MSKYFTPLNFPRAYTILANTKLYKIKFIIYDYHNLKYICFLYK